MRGAVGGALKPQSPSFVQWQRSTVVDVYLNLKHVKLHHVSRREKSVWLFASWAHNTEMTALGDILLLLFVSFTKGTWV
jgi:hypothetical protein